MPQKYLQKGNFLLLSFRSFHAPFWYYVTFFHLHPVLPPFHAFPRHGLQEPRKGLLAGLMGSHQSRKERCKYYWEIIKAPLPRGAGRRDESIVCFWYFIAFGIKGPFKVKVLFMRGGYPYYPVEKHWSVWVHVLLLFSATGSKLPWSGNKAGFVWDQSVHCWVFRFVGRCVFNFQSI